MDFVFNGVNFRHLYSGSLYMDALSPVRTCDPWAVHCAKSFEKHTGVASTLTPIQAEIIRILKETGGIEPPSLLEGLSMRITFAKLEREFAVLRHLEKARGEKRDNKIYWRLWDE